MKLLPNHIVVTFPSSDMPTSGLPRLAVTLETDFYKHRLHFFEFAHMLTAITAPSARTVVQ